jgi:hypothetical protein
MTIDLPRTEAGLLQRRTDALSRMRTAERLAYFQAALAAIVYVLLAANTNDWTTPVNFLATGAIIAPLGWAVGRRHSAVAAACLVVLVLGLTVLQLASGGRSPAVIVVAIFAWKYGQAFNAAREYMALQNVQIEPVTGAT